MDIASKIGWAWNQVTRLPQQLPWRQSVLEQLKYCEAVASGKELPERLEELTMSLVALRELDEHSELSGTISEIQYELQQKHLSYAAKVRLGIHKRA